MYPDEPSPVTDTILFILFVVLLTVLGCNATPTTDEQAASDSEVIQVTEDAGHVYIVAHISNFNAWNEEANQNLANMFTQQSFQNGAELVQMILLDEKSGSYLLVFKKVVPNIETE